MPRPHSSAATTIRLIAAAVLALLPIGAIWTQFVGYLTPGFTVYGDCGYSSGPFCSPDMYIPGVYYPGRLDLVSQSPDRLFLVGAAVALLLAALLPRTAGTRRLAAVGCLALAVAVVEAMAMTSTVVLCGLAALALAVPPVWRGRRPGAVVGYLRLVNRM